MRKEYEEIVRNVCRLSNWKAASSCERQGAIGVACVLAFLRGVPAMTNDLASHIGLSPAEVQVPFKRLLVNGVFSNSYDIRNDPIFQGRTEDKPIMAMDADGNVFQTSVFTSSEQTQNAWAVLAGIAGGLTGLRESEPVEA